MRSEHHVTSYRSLICLRVRLGHGSGWRKDTGLSLNQQWQQQLSDGVIDKRINSNMKKMKKGHKLQGDIWHANDISNDTSVKQLSLKMKKQNEYLARQACKL